MSSEPGVADAVRALLTPHPSLGLPIPAYGGRSLPNVTASVARALDVRPEDGVPLLPPLDEDLDPFAGRRSEGPIVVFLVDALGWSALPAIRSSTGGEPGLEWLRGARPITSVFPTTTTVALTSLSTGESPSRHGVVGHRIYLPTFGAVTEILRMAPSGVREGDAFVGPEWTPDTVSGVPTAFRRGLPATALTRERFEHSAFTRMVYDGASFVGYNTASEFAHQLTALLDRSEPPPVIYAYWDDLDTVQHLRGPLPEFAEFELGQIDRILAAVARRLPSSRLRQTTLLLTSDHGQVATTPAAEVALDREPAIRDRLTRPPCGDRRAGFLAARPGELDALARAVAERFPAGTRVIGMSEAVSGGLFGGPPYHPELAARLGDLLVLPPPPAGLTYRLPGQPLRTRHLAGAHGGIDPEELLVPLVTGSLSDLFGRPADR